MDDSIGAFSIISKGVAFVEDPRAYIHCYIESLGSEDLMNMYMNIITDKNGVVKLEHKVVEDLGFIDILHMSKFLDEAIPYVLSRVHSEFMWLD